MKKLLLLMSMIFIVTGCVNINNVDYKENINNTIKDNKNNKLYNHIGNGYKYYLPKYMSVKNSINYNEKINSDDYTYYLYVDVISYYNKKNITTNGVVDYKFNYDGISGYLDITSYLSSNPKDKNKYLVEIIYNYAKIEVIVEENDINEAINNSIIILSTIKYDDDLIKNLIDENKISSKEENISIFDSVKNKEDFLEVIEEYDNYEEETDIPDFDVIN